MQLPTVTVSGRSPSIPSRSQSPDLSCPVALREDHALFAGEHACSVCIVPRSISATIYVRLKSGYQRSAVCQGCFSLHASIGRVEPVPLPDSRVRTLDLFELARKLVRLLDSVISAVTLELNLLREVLFAARCDVTVFFGALLPERCSDARFLSGCKPRDEEYKRVPIKLGDLACHVGQLALHHGQIRNEAHTLLQV